MKKAGLYLLAIFLTLILVPIIFAEEVQNQTASVKPTGFTESTNKLVYADIQIPDSISKIADNLFGLKGETVEAGLLIILFALWIIVLIIVQAGCELSSVLGKGWMSWVSAVAITALASTTGIFQIAASAIFNIKDIFKAIGNYGFFFIIIAIILLSFLAWGAKALLKYLKNKAKKEEKYQEGFEQGSGI